MIFSQFQCSRVQNGINVYEKDQYKPEVTPPIIVGDGVLVIWDDQSEGVCHYMPRSDLKVIGRCHKFYPGSRVIYCDNGIEWTGRIPKSVNEVFEVRIRLIVDNIRVYIFLQFFLQS